MCFKMGSVLWIAVLILLNMAATEAVDCDALIVDAVNYANDREGLCESDHMMTLNHGRGKNKRCTVIRQYLKRNGGKSCEYMCPECETVARKKLDTDAKGAPPTCDVMAKYRTFDGSCNNLVNPWYGKANTIQLRVVDNAYDDGLGSPRTQGCNGDLPNPRVVSNTIHKQTGAFELEDDLSLMVMQVGQLLAHDIVLTEIFTDKDCEAIECCGSRSNRPGCNPIPIPDDDPFFTEGCMNFQRSFAREDEYSVRQQVNSQSAYLDQSAVYGRNEAEALALRTLEGGQLKSPLGKLPVDLSAPCRLDEPYDLENFYCNTAGDPRVEEQPGLSSIHTLFHREHNKLAQDLAVVNPSWDDEKLYQEARKILIGMWQNIVYTEYLPAILSDDVVQQYNLNILPGHTDYYDQMIDASVFNAFGAAALRYGHTMIHRVVSMVDDDWNHVAPPINLADHWFRPNLYHSFGGQGYQHILRWISSTGCPHADRFLEDTATKLMYLDNDGKSFDLAALNVHRGRDHGLPGYNAYRAFCGLSTASHFGTGPGGLVDHEPEVAALLGQLYDCPGDMDLFPALLSETRSEGSVLGPLGQCLIATQFRNLRKGDRFFYDREENGFTADQLAEIKNVRLSTLMCDVTSTMEIQENVFITPKNPGTYKDCSQIHTIDLNLWKEE